MNKYKQASYRNPNPMTFGRIALEMLSGVAAGFVLCAFAFAVAAVFATLACYLAPGCY